MEDELPSDLLGEIVAVDLEIHPVSKALLVAGAFRQGREPFKRSGTLTDPQTVLCEMGEYSRGARFVLGHNLIFHDLPWLREHDPDNPINSLPGIDTLLLSPLAFPRHPYHRLWKGYKPTESSRNDPLRDSVEAFGLFREQVQILRNDPLLPVYLALLAQDSRARGGVLAMQEFTGVQALPVDDARQQIRERFAEKACRKQLVEFPEFSEFSESSPESAPDWISAAMAVAWLSVAGGTSRLAPWVVHTFPRTTAYLQRLRQIPCGECSYCNENFSPDEALKRYFGFPEFRSVMENPEVVTQKTIVETILQGQDCLVVLPTGGGKSLCYQLPALMLARQRNLLTLIVSPLQSLMKDQVDALLRRGLANVGAINGLLSLFERAETMEKIALGDIDILWAAPEQMRNRSFRDTLAQREVGLVVVDEAHCLSKWGHDFRPDYLYLCSFLRKLLGNDARMPPIACFTATAKPDAIDEITEYFRQEAGKELKPFIGGAERPNLQFHVHLLGPGKETPDNFNCFSKLDLSMAILKEGLSDGGGAILFTATRKGAEQLARHLQGAGFSAEFFHGGRTPDDKRRVQEDFLAGRLQVMCATNAFGMGVDKADVRVVIHMEVPGSLENYLQEAGRAGRDQKEAHCHLIFSAEDLELQFQLCMDSRIGYGDLVGIFRGIRNLARKQKAGPGHGEIVRTTGEILREEETTTESIDAQDSKADTKVKIAISWLEKLNRLERSWNRTSVIEAKPVPPTLEAALEKVRTLGLPPHVVTEWGRLLQVLYLANADDLLNTDALSGKLGQSAEKLISLLREMRKVGLISHSIHCTALFNNLPATPDDSSARWSWFGKLESRLLEHLDNSEDWATKESSTLDIRIAATCLARDPALAEVRAKDLFPLLKIWRRDALISFISLGSDRCSITRRKSPDEIRKFIPYRQKVGQAFLEALRSKCQRQGRDIRVEFTVEEMEAFLPAMEPPRLGMQSFSAVKTVFLSLDDTKALTVQNGLSVFRPALTLKMKDGCSPPTAKDCRSLEDFFDEKIAQIHVMGQYAEFGKSNIDDAMTMVHDYFSLPRQEFYDSYFQRRKETLHYPTGEESLARIIGKSPRVGQEVEPEFALSEAQQAIVSEGKTKNILILAGPGSGKTKSLVHRAAWLVRVQRVPWGGILVVAFNRSTVLEIRLRLRELLGRDSGRIFVCTYHGLALRIASRSLAVPSRQVLALGQETLMQNIVKDAVKALEAVKGEGRDAVTDGLVSRVRYILVDEYQDINEDQYRMIALLARKDEPEAEREVRLLAVGDDDQNIYAWNGSDVKFIRRFEEDYKPTTHRLLTNYRSSEPITSFCERFIQRLPNRMKKGVHLLSGKAGQLLPENNRAPVVVRVPSADHLDAAILAEIERWRGEDFACEEIAILAFQNADLFRLKFILELRGISTHLIKRMELYLPKVREIHRLICFMDSLPADEMTSARFRDAVSQARNPVRNPENPWENLIDRLVDDYLEENRRPTPKDFQHFVYDVGRELRLGELRRPGRITLVTMHAAKGLEFPAAIVVPQGLRFRPDDCRVAYVAMTRAQKALSIIGTDTPGSVARDLFSHEKPIDWTGEVEDALGCFRVWELGLRDVHVSFAARDADHERIAEVIAKMEYDMVGCLVGAAITVEGVEICRLSKKGQERLATEFGGWQPIEARCYAIVSRCRIDESPETHYNLQREDWEIPLFRVIFSRK